MNKKQTVDERESLMWFKDLLKIDTTNAHGNEIEAAEYIQAILKQEGIDSNIFQNNPGRANLVAKLGDDDGTPLLLISHLDVVEVEESKWKHPPFNAVLDEGEIWARGTLDTKHLTVMQLTAFIELKRQDTPLNRAIYFIATADEENGSTQGMKFMTEQHPEYIPDGVVINEGGGFYISYRNEDYLLLSIGEKGSCTVTIETTGQGGHASCPPENQAVQKLSEVIRKLIEKPLPPPSADIGNVFLNTLGINNRNEKTMDDCFDIKNDQEKMLQMLYRYMHSNATNVNCIDVGEQINAIPYKATAEIEFKLLPGIAKSDIATFLQKALGGLTTNWEIKHFQRGFINDADSLLVSTFQRAVQKFGFKGKLLPFLALGKTDGRFLENSYVYGFSPVGSDTPFTKVLEKVHNHNESISESSFLFGTKVMKETVMNYCQYK